MVTDNTQPLPRIHVSSLGSFEFCPRAGVIAFNSQPDEEHHEDPRVPNLSYLPMFDEEALHEKFKAIFPGLKLSWSVLIVSGILLLLIAQFGSTTLAVMLFLAILLMGFVALRDTFILISILAELSKYKHRPATPLDRSLNKELSITWWGLVKCGYKPIKPGASCVDIELGLSGKPWRLLTNNDGERIPVIGFHPIELDAKDSHRRKLAAYCYLLETQQSATADWGILLDLATRRGIAIPMGVLRQHQTLELLKAFRKVLGDRSVQLPIAIPPTNACQNCPHGKPRVYMLNSSETKNRRGTIGANTEKGKAGHLVHSTCGDEFHWVPPHNYWATPADKST